MKKSIPIDRIVNIHLDWFNVDNPFSQEWETNNVIYLYFIKTKCLYLGKAHRRTVRQRYEDPDKDKMLKIIYKIYKRTPSIRVGYVRNSAESEEAFGFWIAQIEKIMIFVGSAMKDEFALNRAGLFKIHAATNVRIINNGDYSPMQKVYRLRYAPRLLYAGNRIRKETRN